ncbi:MAG: hypothetical protein U1C46_01665 [Bacteroidales bacterium]|nr:hypothetical protein [Bacteroidales bacterium]MDZ4203501.1 hypothetical protein [Bacteroidales bacterium]
MNTSSFHKFIQTSALAWLLAMSVVPAHVAAQSFGRNKPSYRTFDFKVYRGPNFELYYYFDNDTAINQLANMSEKWFVRHQEIFGDTFPSRNPIIIYENHPDFQQTTAISGSIGIGTQGVTEALKNRVVIPVLETNAQTNHVLGHELVHAFQFNMLINNDSLSLRMIENLPLWMVEGMAEYLSIGSVDAHTAMIMRDALANDDFPTIRKMTRQYKYNPYRYGHSWWSFVAGVFGDTIVRPLFMRTAKVGYEAAIKQMLKIDHKELSEAWKRNLIEHYQPWLADSMRNVTGRKLIFERNAGEINISPSVSPDGSFIAFFSEKNLFTLDLFIADATTGKVRHKLTSSTRNQDIDGFNFFESVGSWSPDSKQFAYVAIVKGKNNLAIVNVSQPRNTEMIEIPGVPSFNNPSWSPDGRYIVFTGQVNGLSNLYLFDVAGRRTRQLTYDQYSYIHPSWSPDGRYILFATDRIFEKTQSDQVNYNFNIGYLSIEDPSQITLVALFPGADNVNPRFSPSGTTIYFLSNRDGLRNLYEYEPESGKVFRLTNYMTGITGITMLSPAFSISNNNKIVYSHLHKGQYSIYSADLNEFNRVEVDPAKTDFTAAILPPVQRGVFTFVDENIALNPIQPIFPADSFEVQPYKPRFALDYIGNTGMGVAVGNYGTGMAGGIFMLFGDILGNNQMFSTISLNGEIYDFGAQVGFLNQKSRLKWGASISHAPYRYSMLGLTYDTILIEGQPTHVENLKLFNFRTFEDQVSLFAWYPMSTTRRVEVGTSAARYYYRLDVFNNYYQGYFRIGQTRERLPTPPGFNLLRASGAYVEDNSFFGLASPMMGHRLRLQADQYLGRMTMTNAVADFRQYFYLKPFALAFRMSHYGRYGKDADNDNNLFYDYFLGYPGMVRGFSSNKLYNMDMFINNDSLIYMLVGSRVALVSAEIRLPLTGPRRLALIKSGFLFSEAALFFDSGLAWNSIDKPKFDPNNIGKDSRYPVFSIGASIRINLFGALVLEPYYAFPFIGNSNAQGVWGLNFMPGW